jgi:hypothetical protein
MEKDIKLEKLRKEFASLDAGEKDHILGISRALEFTVQQQGLSPGNRDNSAQGQGGEPKGAKTL